MWGAAVISAMQAMQFPQMPGANILDRPYLKDPFDDHVLELALASQSRYIVTFNKKDL